MGASGSAKMGTGAGVQAQTDKIVPLTLLIESNDDVTMALAREIPSMMLCAR